MESIVAFFKVTYKSVTGLNLMLGNFKHCKAQLFASERPLLPAGSPGNGGGPGDGWWCPRDGHSPRGDHATAPCSQTSPDPRGGLCPARLWPESLPEAQRGSWGGGAASASPAVSWRGSHTPGSVLCLLPPSTRSTNPSDPSCQWASGQSLCPVPCWALSFHLLHVRVPHSPRSDPGEDGRVQRNLLGSRSAGRVTGSSPGIPCCESSPDV